MTYRRVAPGGRITLAGGINSAPPTMIAHAHVKGASHFGNIFPPPDDGCLDVPARGTSSTNLGACQERGKGILGTLAVRFGDMGARRREGAMKTPLRAAGPDRDPHAATPNETAAAWPPRLSASGVAVVAGFLEGNEVPHVAVRLASGCMAPPGIRRQATWDRSAVLPRPHPSQPTAAAYHSKLALPPDFLPLMSHRPVERPHFGHGRTPLCSLVPLTMNTLPQ